MLEEQSHKGFLPNLFTTLIVLKMVLERNLILKNESNLNRL
jgi:hypothetical protein